MSEKKVVEFSNVYSEPSIGRIALLYGVKGHYRLGDADFVYTSKVVDVRDDGNTIETKNTIYKKKGGAIEE